MFFVVPFGREEESDCRRKEEVEISMSFFSTSFFFSPDEQECRIVTGLYSRSSSASLIFQSPSQL